MLKTFIHVRPEPEDGGGPRLFYIVLHVALVFVAMLDNVDEHGLPVEIWLACEELLLDARSYATPMIHKIEAGT